MLSQLKRAPLFLKVFVNTFAPYLGAGIRVTQMDLDAGMVDVEMPLTRLNKTTSAHNLVAAYTA